MKLPTPPKARTSAAARQNGYAARANGFLREDNPHSPGEEPILHAAWNGGWEQRDEEMAERGKKP